MSVDLKAEAERLSKIPNEDARTEAILYTLTCAYLGKMGGKIRRWCRFCEKNIDSMHPNAKFCSHHCKDSFWNRLRKK